MYCLWQQQQQLIQWSWGQGVGWRCASVISRCACAVVPLQSVSAAVCRYELWLKGSHLSTLWRMICEPLPLSQSQSSTGWCIAHTHRLGVMTGSGCLDLQAYMALALQRVAAPLDSSVLQNKACMPFCLHTEWSGH